MHFRDELSFDGEWGDWSGWTQPCIGNNINGARIQIYYWGLNPTFLDTNDDRGATNVRLYCNDGTIKQKKDRDKGYVKIEFDN